jgi:hypothetical protein
MQFLSLHVKGFPPGISVEEIKIFYKNLVGFEPRGVKITQTGAVLISFNDREAAKLAKERTNGIPFNNDILEVFYFEPKELREINRLQEIDRRAREERH